MEEITYHGRQLSQTCRNLAIQKPLSFSPRMVDRAGGLDEELGDFTWSIPAWLLRFVLFVHRLDRSKNSKEYFAPRLKLLNLVTYSTMLVRC
jgi:hypothetical protein